MREELGSDLEEAMTIRATLTQDKINRTPKKTAYN